MHEGLRRDERLIKRQGEYKDTRWLARNNLWMPGLDNQMDS